MPAANSAGRNIYAPKSLESGPKLHWVNNYKSINKWIWNNDFINKHMVCVSFFPTLPKCNMGVSKVMSASRFEWTDQLACSPEWRCFCHGALVQLESSPLCALLFELSFTEAPDPRSCQQTETLVWTTFTYGGRNALIRYLNFVPFVFIYWFIVTLFAQTTDRRLRINSWLISFVAKVS